MITPKQIFDLWRDNDLLPFESPMEGETYAKFRERVGDDNLGSDRMFHFALAELCTEDIDLEEAERRLTRAEGDLFMVRTLLYRAFEKENHEPR